MSGCASVYNQKAKPMLVTQHRLLWSKCLEDTDDSLQSYHLVNAAASRGFTDRQSEAPGVGTHIFY